MHIVFFSTNSVFEAEEKLQNAGIKCKIVSTPIVNKAYCGVCVKVEGPVPKTFLIGMEYIIID